MTWSAELGVQLRPGQEREAWVDAAKGLCMVLVVVMHVTIWFDGQVGETTAWQHVTDFLAPVRMPLFFALSGLLAATALRRPFTEGVARKAGVLAFVYALWTALLVARQALPIARADGDRAPTVWDVLWSFVVPTSLWYLWALAGFYMLSFALHRVLGRRRAWALAPMAALSVGAPFLAGELIDAVASADPVTLGWAASNLVWFYLGTIGRPALRWVQDRASVGAIAAVLAGYVAVFAGAGAVGADATVVLAPLGLAAAALCSVLLPFTSAPAAGLRWVGAGTLAVYVMHFLAISAVSAVVGLSGLGGLFRAAPQQWGVIVPPLIALVIVVGCRVAGALVSRSPLRWALLGPRALRRSRVS